MNTITTMIDHLNNLPNIINAIEELKSLQDEKGFSDELILAGSINALSRTIATTNAAIAASSYDHLPKKDLEIIDEDAANASLSLPTLPALYRINHARAQDHFLKWGQMAMGWPVSTTPIDFAHYVQQANLEYSNGYFHPVVTMHDLPHHAVVWTRKGYKKNTLFYVGLVNGPWVYRTDQAAIDIDSQNVRDVIWYEVGGYDKVPAEVAKQFTPSTFSQIKSVEVLKYTQKLAASLVAKGVWPTI